MEMVQCKQEGNQPSAQNQRQVVKTGIGECAPLPGLNTETPEEVERLLNDICANPTYFLKNPEAVKKVSSVRFALETALRDLQNGGQPLV